MSQKLKSTDKWCPMVRFDVGSTEEGLIAVNRRDFDPIPEQARCLGERCGCYVGTDANGYCGMVRT